jgi:hypothetical protein
MRSARRAGCLFLATLASSAVIVAIGQSTVAASCTTGAFPSAAVTGVVVSTSIDPDTGVFAEVRSENGETRTVVFYGRNPNNKLPDGTENSVEDSWTGQLPAVGGRYTITGAEFQGADGPLGVTMCAESPSVAVLAAPPVTAGDSTEPPTVTAAAPSTTDSVNQSSPGGDGSRAATVAVLIGAVLGVGALVVAVRRRAPPTSARPDRHSDDTR